MSVHAATPELHEHADSWHHHELEEGLPQSEHTGVVEPSALIKWFFLIVIALAIVLVALFTYFDSYNHRLKATRLETLNTAEANIAKAQAESRLGLGGASAFQYVPVTNAPGKVHLPLDRAMERVLDTYGKETP